MKRSAEVEALLKAHSYARPLVPLDRASTDGDTAAAHQVGPRAVPVGVDTPAPEPRLQLSQSLVEDMKSPPAPKAVAVAVKEVRAAEVITAEPLSRKAVHAAPRQIDVQTYVLTRRSPKRVALMTVGAIAILGATVWIVRRANLEEEGGKGPSVVTAPSAPAMTAVDVATPVVVAPPPVVPPPVVTTATPAPAPAPTPAAKGDEPRPVRASPSPPSTPRAAPPPRPATPPTTAAPRASAAPPIDQSTLYNDFKVKN